VRALTRPVSSVTTHLLFSRGRVERTKDARNQYFKHRVYARACRYNATADLQPADVVWQEKINKNPRTIRGAARVA